ncbi:MAG: VanZ family protein [Melioribacteraceae bacterium]|nr:VanZ family protein [Melioribacteraceae bacterium]
MFLYLPLGLYWLLIFILTSIPGNHIPTIFGTSDKLKHFGAYLVLAFLLNFTLYIQKKFPLLSKKSMLFTFLITTFYGIIDEVHQIFIPGRAFDWWDLVADGLGSLIGILLVKVIISENLNSSKKNK